MPNTLFGDITNEIIECIYNQTKKSTNKKKIKLIIDLLGDIIFNDLKPYLYTILAVLILSFLMNSFNFYYYIKLFMKSNPDLNINV